MAWNKSSWKKLGQNLTSCVLQGKTRVKFSFLVLSIIMWLLIKLSKPGYVSEVSVPVSFSHLPEDKVLLDASHQALQLRLKANGFVLLKYNFLNFNELQVDLSDLHLGKKEMGSWPTSYFKSDIEAQFLEDVQLLRIRPDTLRFQISTLAKKKVLVNPQVKIGPSSTRHLYQPPLTNPSMVEVQGPRSEIEKVDTLITETWTIDATAQDTIVRELGLQLPDLPFTSFSRQSVSTRVVLAELTENTVQVPIQARNVPSNLQIELFPRKVAITYQVALQDYDRIQTSDFQVYVNFENGIQTKEGSLKIYLEEAPSLVRNARLGSKRAEYIAMQP